MSDDGVVLWHDHDEAHDLSFEIVQIAEGEFELRVVCDGRLWLEEDSDDLETLIERARELRADVHPAGQQAAEK
jgi:hypothetical protein